MGRPLVGYDLYNPRLMGVGNWRLFDAVVAPTRDEGDFTTVDQAIDAGALSIFVKPGTYSKFTADVAGLYICGAGKTAIIDGAAAGHAITVSAADVEIENLAVKTTAGGGNNYDGIAISARCRITRITGIASDRYFISIADGGDDSIVALCRSLSSDSDGIYIANAADNCVVGGNRLDGWVGEGIDDDTTGPTTTTFGNDVD